MSETLKTGDAQEVVLTTRQWIDLIGRQIIETDTTASLFIYFQGTLKFSASYIFFSWVSMYRSARTRRKPSP